MSFDDQVDRLKDELRTSQLEPAQRAEAVAALVGKLQSQISSRRLDFALNQTPGSYSLTVRHTGSREDLAAIMVNEDGSITFRAIATDQAGVDDDDDLGYFPAYVEYFDEAEFLEDIPEVLKPGVAEYELDQEEDGAHG